MPTSTPSIELLRDPKFYLENFTKIKGKKPGSLIPFILNEAQKDLYNTVSEQNRVIILKARQIGFSTAMVGYFYHDTIMNPGTNTALIGYNSDLTAELLDKVKVFYRTTPPSLRPTIQYNSKYEISFPKINSKILVLPSTQNVGRGYTLTNVLCLSGETAVYSRNGVPVKIKDLASGTEILNGNGSYSKVKMVVSRSNKEEMVKMSVYGCDPLILTKDHQVFVRSDDKKGEWKRARDITKEDCAAYPYFQNRNKTKKVKLKSYVNEKYKSRSFKLEEIELTRDFGELCGWYISEGSFNKTSVTLSVHKKEVRYLSSLIERSISNYVSSWNIGYSKDSETALIHLYGAPLCNWLAENFGEGCENKRIDDRMWRWGWDFAYGLLRGVVLGDGCLKNKHRTTIVTTSPGLAYQLKRFMVSVRIALPSVQHQKTSRYGKPGMDRYNIVLSGKGNYKLRRKLGFELPVYDNGRARWKTENAPWINQGGGYWKRGRFYYWGKVRKVEIVPAEDVVYDIVLEKEPHSFVANGVVVHNCTELSSWDDAEEKMMTLEASVPIDGKLVIESCVTGDTIVFTSQGPVFMEDIHSWEENPLGFSEGKEILLDGHYGLKPTTTYYNSGVQPGFRIRTRCGYELGMSSIHKIYVLRGDELVFVEAKDLRPGDKVAVKHGQELWGHGDDVDWKPTPYPGFNKQNIKLFCPEKIDSELAYLIGVILGDGYVSKRSGQVVITTIDEEVSEFLLHNNLGLKFYRGSNGNHWHYYCSNQSFIEFLQNFIGFEEGVKAPKKKIPSCVLGWSRKNVVAFLQGLFDSDGSCRKDRKQVSFVSTSKEIMDVLHVLLLNFGIVSTVRFHLAKPTKRVKVSSPQWTLEISRSHSKVFLEKIGFRIKRKQKVVEKNGSYDCLQESIPGLGKVLREKQKELGFYIRSSQFSNKSFFSASGDITYRTLRKVLDACQNKESTAYAALEELYEKHYFYDEIKEIIPIKEQVYDFTVEDGHTFTNGGFVGHNTPKGQGNLYHRMWMTDDNGYAKKEYGWWWGYNKEEIELIRKRMNNPSKFAQEYGLEFLASGRSVFDAYVIQEMRTHIWRENQVYVDAGIEYAVHIKDHLRIYKPPVTGRNYVIGVDVSEGVEGGDFSVAVVFDRQTGEEVAMFRGLLPPDRFADKLNAWGREYNDALLVVEVNNHGLTTLTCLKQKIYPTLYFRPKAVDTLGVTSSDKFGWKTNKVTRPLLIDDFAQACRDKVLTLHSKELLDEMSVFVYDDGGNMVPMGGFHDDCIFAAGIGFQGFKIMPMGKLDQLNYADHMPTSFAY